MTTPDLLAEFNRGTRLARLHSGAMPISTGHSAPTPCVSCGWRPTRRANGVCDECRREETK